MRKLIISIFVILSSVFILDRIGGKAMRWVSLHTNNSSAPKMRYFVYQPKDDIVFMGTSRCNNHYVSSIIQDSIGMMSVYNGGVTATSNIYSHYILLNLMQTKYAPTEFSKPKVICLDVYNQDFCPGDEHAFRSTAYFAPYFGLNKRVDSVYMASGLYRKYKISHLYRHNAKAIQNLAGLIINKQQEVQKGYTPIPKPWEKPRRLQTAITNTQSDALKLEYLSKFSEECKENNIILVFIISPKYEKIDAHYYDVLKDFAEHNNIPVLDYHTNGLFLDHPEYFANPLHLCNEGACIFSSILAHDLKQLLCSFNLCQ